MSHGSIGATEASSRLIVGGIVAHNDEGGIEGSIRSLLSQELPCDARWGKIWVVASGCTDRTVEVAQAMACDDPRIGLVVEPERRGKSAAIREVLRRAEGDLLVLLNSDAVAAPGSVTALLSKASGKLHPFAVMARPVAPSFIDGAWSRTMRWMWDFHHELHLEMLADGRGAHLSDELLLVSLPAVPWIEDGIINDGSYCAVWLREHAGTCWYAPDARVAIDLPRNPEDHLRQRRRIHVGNAQVSEHLGRPPTTAVRFFFRHPTRALRAFRRAMAQEHGVRHLIRIAGWELVAHALALWDRIPPRRDHVRWSRISAPVAGGTPLEDDGPASSHPQPSFDHRVRVLLEVAREFGTGIPLARLAELLPGSAPVSEEELREFFLSRPELASVEQGRVYGSSFVPSKDPERLGRGVRYHREAEALAYGTLSWLHPWLRCVGVTGSTAYGEPKEGDDLDFYVVTRRGAVPWFLFATYLTLRLRRGRVRGSAQPTPCFNYVVDDLRAPRDFAHGRGLLFAREALSARILIGDSYYRGLLAGAPWLATEIPRLYAARSLVGDDTTSRPAPLAVRILSDLVFLPLAAYLQLTGLRRNARARREGRHSEVFRTVTTPDRFAFQSRRFEQLRLQYESTPESTPAHAATGSPSRIPTAR